MGHDWYWIFLNIDNTIWHNTDHACCPRINSQFRAKVGTSTGSSGTSTNPRLSRFAVCTWNVIEYFVAGKNYKHRPSVSPVLKQLSYIFASKYWPWSFAQYWLNDLFVLAQYYQAKLARQNLHRFTMAFENFTNVHIIFYIKKCN